MGAEAFEEKLERIGIGKHAGKIVVRIRNFAIEGRKEGLHEFPLRLLVVPAGILGDRKAHRLDIA